MPEIEKDGEELTRLSPGVGCDSTAQGDGRPRYTRIRVITRRVIRRADCSLLLKK